jgi:uncharacterized repeat protein (TIGR01451 family)
VAQVVPAGCDHLQIMPPALIAPVGSEMLLKANIWSQGSLLASRPVNWSLGQNGVGIFTEMGFRDRAQLLSFWEAPQKIDDWSACSYTAAVPITLNTSTPDPNDDIPIQRGEAWVTLTSACEGASVVTACTPALDQYNQATATIYWIDAQWAFTQTTTAEAGRPHTVTTTVMRRTDGAPLPGWIVRYDVGGNAGLGYEGGGSVEATTDAAGRASVEVSPRDPGGGVTNVGITIIRPATAGPTPMPRLELGRAASTITWGAAAIAPAVPAPGLPMPPAPLPAAPTSPPPTLPSTNIPDSSQNPPGGAPTQNPYSSPPAGAAGTPRLEVTLGAAEPAQVAIGQNVSFLLTVTNRGDGVARNIKISDRFDRGLQFGAPNGQALASPVQTGMQDLQPNDSKTMYLTFKVIDGGLQCHDVTVSADGVDPATQRGCVTPAVGSLSLEIEFPVQRKVGEIASMSAVIRNTGTVTVNDVELVARVDSPLVITSAGQGHVPLADGGVMLKISSLAPSEKRTFPLEAQCRTPSDKACVTVIASANGITPPSRQKCLQILPLLPAAGADTAAANDLRLTVSTPTNPARVGQKQQINVVIENAGQQVERNINMRVILPAAFTPDPTSIQPLNEARVTSADIQFNTIAELAPGQQRQYVIPVTPNQTGQVQVTAQIASSTVTTPRTVNSDMINILGASP